LRPVGAAAAVVQIVDINKGKFAYNCQSAMSLLVIDFTFLEGRDGELVVKELTLVDSHSNRSRHLYVIGRTVGKKYQRLTPEYIRL